MIMNGKALSSLKYLTVKEHVHNSWKEENHQMKMKVKPPWAESTNMIERINLWISADCGRKEKKEKKREQTPPPKNTLFLEKTPCFWRNVLSEFLEQLGTCCILDTMLSSSKQEHCAVLGTMLSSSKQEHRAVLGTMLSSSKQEHHAVLGTILSSSKQEHRAVLGTMLSSNKQEHPSVLGTILSRGLH